MHTASLWQRAVAEFIGLFLMTSIGLMTVATAITAGAYGLFELSMAFAFTIMLIVIAIGAYSGAHINPAISIALALYGRFPWREVPAYIAAQIAGGVAGSTVLYLLYSKPIRAFEAAKGITRGDPDSSLTAMIFNCFAPNPAIAGANKWGTDFISTPLAIAGEAFGTFVLALVLFLMLDPKNGFAPGLKGFAINIGLVVGFIIMVLAPLTMSGINPARDLGPRITTWFFGWGDVSFPGIGPAWWVWTVGPIIGAIAGGGVAVLMGRFLQTRRAAASSDLDVAVEEPGAPKPVAAEQAPTDLVSAGGPTTTNA